MLFFETISSKDVFSKILFSCEFLSCFFLLNWIYSAILLAHSFNLFYILLLYFLRLFIAALKILRDNWRGHIVGTFYS